MRPFVSTIKVPEDYMDITEGMVIAQGSSQMICDRKGNIQIPTEYRWWEYGSALQFILNHKRFQVHFESEFSPVEVLNIGAGFDALSPALCLCFDNTIVTEYEPGEKERNDRYGVNEILKSLGKREIQLFDYTMEKMPSTKFDVVLCVSVMEHVEVDYERQAWLDCAKRVREGGLLFISTDVCPRKVGPYPFDYMRMQNYVIEEMKERVDSVVAMGFTPYGDDPEYVYNGDYVFGYTFFRCALVKKSPRERSDGWSISEDQKLPAVQ